MGAMRDHENRTRDSMAKAEFVENALAELINKETDMDRKKIITKDVNIIRLHKVMAMQQDPLQHHEALQEALRKICRKYALKECG